MAARICPRRGRLHELQATNRKPLGNWGFFIRHSQKPSRNGFRGPAIAVPRPAPDGAIVAICARKPA